MSTVIRRPPASEQQQMDAVVIQAGGPPAESLAVRSEPVPEPGPGEVLVEVSAAAVNPLDAVNALGLLGTPLPMIPGVDYAGVVVSDGDHTGQQVWGSAPQLGMQRPAHMRASSPFPPRGSHAKPERLTMTEAAAVGRPYLAAWQTVIEDGELKPGETLLITGGAGLVGRASHGDRALARRGADHRRPAQADGIEHFIDTSLDDLREAVHELTGGRGADMVLDTVGGALFELALLSLRFGGRMAGLISHEPRVEFDLVEFYGRELHLTGLASVFMDGAHVANIFDQLRALFDRGVLAPPGHKHVAARQQRRGLPDGA